MRQRTLPRGSGIALLIVLLLGLYATLVKSKPASPAAVISSKGDSTDFWPLQMAWTWKVDPISTKAMVGVCIRTVESEIPEQTMPSFSIDTPLPSQGNDKLSSYVHVGDERIGGEVRCQLVDLREIGLQELTSKPLRLVVKLKVHSTLTRVGDPTLEGDQLLHVAPIEPKWEGDSLHVLTVHTAKGNRLFAHHVFVVQKDIT